LLQIEINKALEDNDRLKAAVKRFPNGTQWCYRFYKAISIQDGDVNNRVWMKKLKT
jgi:hypothetical protein